MMENIIYECECAADRGEYYVSINFRGEQSYNNSIGKEYLYKVSKDIRLLKEKGNIWSKMIWCFSPMYYNKYVVAERNVEKAYYEISKDIEQILTLPPYSFNEVFADPRFWIGFEISLKKSEEIKN